LKGEQIPLGARILSAVDCLDALASQRQYRHALSLEEAMHAVELEAGKSYDPKVVEILRTNFVEMEQKARSAGGNGHSIRDCRVDRMVEPATGFETGSESAPARPPWFLTRIGAARQEVQLLFEIAQEMVSSLRLCDMMSQLGSRLKALVSFDAIAVYMVRDYHLEAAYVDGDDAALLLSLRIPFGQGLSGWVVQNRLPVLNGNPAVEPGYLNDPKVFSVHRSSLSVPIEGSGGVLGALTLYSKQGKAFSREDLRVMLAISSKLGVAIENSLRYQEAEENAGTDFLTGLPNSRALFTNLAAELSAAEKSEQPAVIFLVDLDGFKKVNDTFGHLTGNQLLKAVAHALRQQCRPGDLVARMGGDEFVVVCPGMPASMIDEVVSRLTHSVEQTGMAVLGRPALSASVGSAVFPADGQHAEELLAEADRTMYRAKESAGQRLRDLINLATAVDDKTASLPSGKPGPGQEVKEPCERLQAS
jgi:diguanylate cyclase (GGDEF)-like protein